MSGSVDIMAKLLRSSRRREHFDVRRPITPSSHFDDQILIENGTHVVDVEDPRPDSPSSASPTSIHSLDPMTLLSVPDLLVPDPADDLGTQYSNDPHILFPDSSLTLHHSLDISASVARDNSVRYASPGSLHFPQSPPRVVTDDALNFSPVSSHEGTDTSTPTSSLEFDSSPASHHEESSMCIDPRLLSIGANKIPIAPNLPLSEADAQQVSSSETPKARYSSVFIPGLSTLYVVAAPATIGDHGAAHTTPSPECTHTSSQPMTRAVPFSDDVAVVPQFDCESTPPSSGSSSSPTSSAIQPIQPQAHGRSQCSAMDESLQVKREMVQTACSALKNIPVDCGWNGCDITVVSGQLMIHIRETHLDHHQGGAGGAELVRCRRTGCTLPHELKLQSLEKHVFSKCHLKLQVECPRCKRLFSRGDALRRHMNGRSGTLAVA